MPIKKQFQLRLLTLLTLSLSVSALLWLNLRCSPGYPYIADWELQKNSAQPIFKHDPSIGWPRAFVYRNHQMMFGAPTQNGHTLAILIPDDLGESKINRKYLAIDLAIALGLLLFVGITCEWILRRKFAPIRQS